ncbi:MAG: family 43 glycosylhydrolase [Lachnospiraceae bacterium]|nr:family 43 glycosylhydrolase [Lachnospiraceae bacterium]
MLQNELYEQFNNITIKTGYKQQGEHNPVMTQRFGADPYALVYGGRVYLYMTGDAFVRNEQGEITENVYSRIDTINVVSSEDLVNWTDHGTVYAAGDNGAAKWGKNSWAPAAVYKEIDGKEKFFLYFANGGNGIAVLEADSPVGPFTDPINKPLISRQTPTCNEVTWLFDPAVLADDDGEAYIYFGGGIPSPDKADNPQTARVAKLGKDMISLDGDPVVIADVPYLFEDSGINKINGTYYYSYCSNFSIPAEKVSELGFDNGEIMVMKSDKPMGPFTLVGPILKNPGWFFGLKGNNHHCLFCFQDKWYMSYHTRILEDRMGVYQNYRSTSIDAAEINENGKISMIQATREGVAQLKGFDPYRPNKAVTMAAMGGIETTQYGESAVNCGSGDMIVTGISDGSWIKVCGVDFGERTAQTLELSVRGHAKGFVKVCVDDIQEEAVCIAELTPESDTALTTCTAKISSSPSGIHDLYFVFMGEGYEVYDWEFQ